MRSHLNTIHFIAMTCFRKETGRCLKATGKRTHSFGSVTTVVHLLSSVDPVIMPYGKDLKGYGRDRIQVAPRRLLGLSYENLTNPGLALPLRQPARIASVLGTDHHVPSIHILSQMNPIHILGLRFSLRNGYQNKQERE
jgi:hypothetical protein